MTRMTLKIKFLLVIVLLMPIFLYSLLVNNEEFKVTTQIFEIENTQLAYSSPGSKVATIEKII